MKTIKAGENNIVWFGSTFKEHFGEMPVDKVNSQHIETRTLERLMSDSEIIKEWGPEEVTIGFFIAALKVLDKSGWYICYIRDAKGTLWAVHGHWHSARDGWDVGAYSVAGPSPWGVGRQFLSSEFSDTKTSSKTPSSSDSLNEFIKDLKALIEKYEN